jgi:hypothetical protein
LTCGWLELPPNAGDPMRGHPTHAPTHRCPRCEGRTWIELADVAAAHAWGELERREIDVRGSPVAAIVLVAAAVVVVVGALGSGLHLALALPLATIATLVGVHGVGRLRAALSVSPRAAYRWHAPALRWSEAEVFLRGAAAGEVLVAPVTGRPALGWRVEVRRADERSDQLALVEQSCAVTSVDGERLDGELTLGISCERVDADTASARDYLRSRGVDPHDALVVREAIVEPGRVVVVRRDRLGGPAVLCEE